MNKLEISGIHNLKGYEVNGWEIYHIEENETTYFFKLRPERDWEDAKHAGVIFELNLFKTKDILWQGIVNIIKEKGVQKYGS